MTAAGKRKVVGIQNGGDMGTGLQDARDDGCIDIRRKPVQQARSTRHGQTGNAYRVFQADFFPAERTLFTGGNRAVLNDGVQRVVFGIGAAQWNTGGSNDGTLPVWILLQFVIQIHVFAHQFMEIFQLSFGELQMARIT